MQTHAAASKGPEKCALVELKGWTDGWMDIEGIFGSQRVVSGYSAKSIDVSFGRIET